MRGTEWAPLYLLVVLAIAAILLVTFVKPLFRQAAVTADDNTKAAKDAAKSAMPLLAFLPASRKAKNGKKKPLSLAFFDLFAFFFFAPPVPAEASKNGGAS